MEENPKILATCSNNGLIVYDCLTNSQLINSQPHNGNINSLSWSHNGIKDFHYENIGQVIATGADDGKIMLTLVSKSQVIETLSEEHSPTIPIHGVAFSSNSLYIGAGSADGVVKIWNLKTRAIQVKSSSHNELVYSVAWNLNDTMLASGSMNGLIALHTTEKQLPIGTLSSVNHVFLTKMLK